MFKAMLIAKFLFSFSEPPIPTYFAFLCESFRYISLLLKILLMSVRCIISYAGTVLLYFLKPCDLHLKSIFFLSYNKTNFTGRSHMSKGSNGK